jgi:hypothetical protein|tara:strand:+ start:533 stop:694 length:162 start_codon:yes stop_codon:yes gene_type:complete
MNDGSSLLSKNLQFLLAVCKHEDSLARQLQQLTPAIACAVVGPLLQARERVAD